MMSKFFFSIFVTLLLVSAYEPSQSQTAGADEYKLSFGGFVKTDAFYDSRLVQSLREGHITLWPEPEKLDANGKDINDVDNINLLSIQTRLFAKATGPGLFGGRTTGYVETEFLGSTNDGINSLRLRHAYVDLDFGNFQIKAGQFWHPLFPVDNVPDVISFNTGIPFIPFNRSPQIKLTQKFDNFRAFLAASVQRDFTSNGPDGYSSKYQKNSVMPELTAGFNYLSPNIAFGIGGSIKTLRPYNALKVNSKDYVNEDKITTYAASANFKAKIDNFYFKMQGTYGQNLADLMMIGGYGVEYLDSSKVDYAPISSFSTWTELMYKKNWEFGVLFGYSKNLGADTDYNNGKSLTTIYGRGLDIDALFKVFPRIAYNFNKTKIAAEIEYTSANFGKTNLTDKAKVEDSKAINNLRVLLGFYVFFNN